MASITLLAISPIKASRIALIGVKTALIIALARAAMAWRALSTKPLFSSFSLSMRLSNSCSSA